MTWPDLTWPHLGGSLIYCNFPSTTSLLFAFIYMLFELICPKDHRLSPGFKNSYIKSFMLSCPHLGGSLIYCNFPSTTSLLFAFIYMLFESICPKDHRLSPGFKNSYIKSLMLSCPFPLRFTPEEKARRDTYDHIPFGYGPRNCIAMRLALMEIKMSAAMLLKHFTFVRCEKTKVSRNHQQSRVSELLGLGIWWRGSCMLYHVTQLEWGILIDWGLVKMDNISQTACSNVIQSMKMLEYR